MPNEVNESNYCSDCSICFIKFKYMALAGSLFLSLVKGAIGILGACESLAADSLYSFFQAYLIFKQGTKFRKNLWPVELMMSVIIIVAVADVFIFSVIRLIAASNGTLLRPSPYAVCAAVVSILANHLFLTYSVCNAKANGHNLTPTFKISIVISGVVLVGVALSRTFLPHGDAFAAIIAGVIVLRFTSSMIARSLKTALLFIQTYKREI